MKFYFWFSWMIMHIIMHEILFFYFLFFSFSKLMYIQIFQWFYKWWFFSKTMFQKICTNFSKEKVCTKDFFNDFEMFQNLCTKEYFSMVSSNVYSKSMYKDFFSSTFLWTFKRIFQWFFLNAYVQRIKIGLKKKTIHANCLNFYVQGERWDLCEKWLVLVRWQKWSNKGTDETELP